VSGTTRAADDNGGPDQSPAHGPDQNATPPSRPVRRGYPAGGPTADKFPAPPDSVIWDDLADALPTPAEPPGAKPPAAKPSQTGTAPTQPDAGSERG
jgi:hypothetical protein